MLKTKENKSAAPSRFSSRLRSSGANVVIKELSSNVDAPIVGSSDESSDDDGNAAMFDASLYGPHAEGRINYYMRLFNGFIQNHILMDLSLLGAFFIWESHHD
ncbi:hypothetical protein AMTRI_Chr01g133720 [Amborella trichopoda]